MNRLRKIFKNMKYRHKLTIFLVVTSLVPMTVLAWYSHSRLSTMVRSSELEDMQSIMEQTRESIDSQTAVYASLLNYLTYSPDIEEIIKEKNIDNYTAYEKYTEIADPLLSVPKSYHDAINRIQLFADSIQVEHEYTLVPLDKMKEEWWSEGLKDDVRIQWKVDRTRGEVVAIRMSYTHQKLNAVLCISLDYDKIFQPLTNILTDENGGIVADKDGNVLYNKTGLKELKLSDDNKKDTSQTADKLLSKISQTCTWTQTKSEENDWVFYFYKSQDAISGSVRRLLLEEIPLIIACGFIILFLGLSFSRIFTRKIEELTKNMDQVNHGSREVTVSSDSEDEVGILINSFHNMMDEINRLIDEVYVNKIALKEYELKALQAQINPHFLYNTLDLINWISMDYGAEEIGTLTWNLARFYRLSLNHGKSLISIGEEVEHVEVYVNIENYHFDNAISLEVDVPEELKSYACLNIILQPFVENAIVHGIAEKPDIESCEIRICARREEQDIVFSVQDDGPGVDVKEMQKETQQDIRTAQHGYGVRNINFRLKLCFGEKYGVTYLESEKGTHVEIKIPVMTMAEAEEKI